MTNYDPQQVVVVRQPWTGESVMLLEFLVFAVYVGYLISERFHTVLAILGGLLIFSVLWFLNKFFFFRIAISVIWGLVCGVWGLTNDAIWGIFGAVCGFSISWLVHTIAHKNLEANRS